MYLSPSHDVAHSKISFLSNKVLIRLGISATSFKLYTRLVITISLFLRYQHTLSDHRSTYCLEGQLENDTHIDFFCEKISDKTQMNPNPCCSPDATLMYCYLVINAITSGPLKRLLYVRL